MPTSTNASPASRPRTTERHPTDTRPSRRIRRRVPGQYNPRIASAGLTIDTDLGPLDQVAVERALSGWAVALNPAERREVELRLARLAEQVTRADDFDSRKEAQERYQLATELAATGLGVGASSVKRAVRRRRVKGGWTR
jgi:regulation of enolase protein 1 (concanavalin A-like superfamily)